MSEYIITDEQIAENRRLHGKKLLVMPIIVRCRDCKHYYAHGVPTCQRNKEWFTGYDISGTYGEWCDGEFYVEPDGFCAWGERREEQ